MMSGGYDDLDGDDPPFDILEEPPKFVPGTLRITQKEMDACIAKHELVLETLVRAPGGSPADGGILTLINTIDALRRLPTQG
jgi:hypothetical protein